MSGTPHGNPFQAEVMAAAPGGDKLITCVQCGTCGGSCPSGPDMDHTPRQLFALINAGERDTVLRSNTPWYCVACYYCTVRCPKEIPITELMYAVKRLSVQQNAFDDSKAPDFSKVFIRWVEEFGRSFEVGLMGVHMVRHNPLGAFKIVDMAVGMITKNRMAFVPTRIRGMSGLKRILAKAKELEAHA